jgi:ribose transport system ATP-binding protein
LRVSQQQVVEIARAISAKARVLIMDEPTSALGRAETERLLALVRDLKREGVAIVYITHKFEELAGLADEIAIMRDGKLLTQVPYAELSHEEIIRLMVGREYQNAPAAGGGLVLETALEVRDLSVRHPIRSSDYLVRNVSLRVGRGEIVGLFGLVGAGRTELLEALFGAHGRRTSGEVLVHGAPVRLRTPGDAVRAGLGLAPEDRKHDGLVLGMSSRENAALARTGLPDTGAFLSGSREAALAGPLLQRLGFRGPSLEEPVRSLSGGNQQKVVLAKWLATQPKVLLLDEPTRGIDVRAKSDFYRCVQELAAQGMGILFASSEIPEVMTLAHRIVVLSEGAVTGEFNTPDATPERLLAAALPRKSRGAVAVSA